MNTTLEQLGIDRLEVTDRLDLIGMIWDSIEDSGRAISVPDWHQAELQARCQAADGNPNAAIPWSIVKERLESAP